MDLSVIPDLTQQGDASPYAADRTVTVGRLAGLVRALSARPRDWWPLARFDGVPVRVPGAHPLWLTAWAPGQHAAPVADVIAMLAGELSERTISGQGASERTLRPGRVRVYGGADHHELVNPGPAYALSLHASAR